MTWALHPTILAYQMFDGCLRFLDFSTWGNREMWSRGSREGLYGSGKQLGPWFLTWPLQANFAFIFVQACFQTFQSTKFQDLSLEDCSLAFLTNDIHFPQSWGECGIPQTKLLWFQPKVKGELWLGNSFIQVVYYGQLGHQKLSLTSNQSLQSWNPLPWSKSHTEHEFEASSPGPQTTLYIPHRTGMGMGTE
jgi:hypothetical protein